MTPYIKNQLIKLCDHSEWFNDMLTSGRFLVSFEVPGPLPGTTEGFCEEMNVVYRTEELNTYLRYPKQEINPWDKHSIYIRLKLREILKVNLTDITIIDIISLP